MLRPAALAVLLALAAPGAALAQDSPFAPLPPAPQTQPAPAPVTTSSTDGSGLNGRQEALIIAAGLVLLAGIAWAIMRDARERAPAVAGEADRAVRSRGRSAQQRARARAKARAARAQRKRNRRRR